MKATYIDYSDTHSFSSTVISYLAEDQKISPFVNKFPELDNFEEIIAKRRDIMPEGLLSEVLRKQYERCCISAESSALVFDNIAKLARKNTYTVTTGHQLNIFTGPLYFIYKIVSAINLARDLKQRYPQHDFVPVYWMATEDHDFAEINHIDILGRRISWEKAASGATGRLSTADIGNAIAQYREVLGLGNNSSEWMQLIEEAYLGQDKLAEATRRLVNALFAEYGLVIVDADEQALKSCFAPFIEADIIEGHSYRLIEEQSARLEAAGFRTQVNPREINFFYMKGDLRERIVKQGDKYFVLNSEISFSETELREEIRNQPERFSPNVIMRPLYQEVILPNLAYIGGGAELTYWLQLKGNFDHYGVDFPVLLLRNSAMLVNESFTNKLCRLRIPVKDIFRPLQHLQNEWVQRNTQQVLSLTDERNELNAIFEKIKLKAYKIDPTLGPSAAAVNARLQKAINNLEKKLLKAEKHHHGDALEQISRMREKYFPGEGLQERIDNFGLYYTLYGKELIGGLIKHLKPLDFKFCILEP